MAKKQQFRNQRERVMNILERRRLSDHEALSKYSIRNLSAVISKLRSHGIDIYTIPRTITKKSTVYGLNQ